MKHTRTLLATLLIAPLVAASFARSAQTASPAEEENDRVLALAEPRIKAIYETNEFALRFFTATWLPDCSGYLKLETPAGASAAEVARYDAASARSWCPQRTSSFQATRDR